MHARNLYVTQRQIALLHVLKRDNRLTDDTYRDLLHEAAGVTSSKQLTQDGFTAVLDLLEALGFEVPERRTVSEFTMRAGRATPAQLRFIEAVGRQLFGSDTALRHWMERFFNVSDLRFLTPHDASRVIDGLSAMRERGWGRAR